MERLSISVFQTRKELKVVLDVGLQFYVSVNALRQAAEEIRGTLTEICREYVHQPQRQRSSESENPKLLRQLALQGYAMRNVFFQNANGIQDSELLRNGYAGRPITFSLDPNVTIHAPWSLMFDPPEKNLRVNYLTKAQLYEGFWCTAHDLTVVYKGSDNQDSELQRLDHQDKTKLLALVDANARQYADPKWRIEWPCVFDSVIEFLQYLIEHENNRERWLFYFFCHAEEDTIVIRSKNGQKENLVPQMFMNYLAGNPEFRRRGLVFLNGCKTGVSKKPPSWQVATRHRGMLGYIGTEAIVPTQFAWRFGNDLMYLLAAGQTPEGAMKVLRARHWPLSLLYGLYCVPDSTVEDAPIETPFPPPQEINYCSQLMNYGDNLLATLPFAQPGMKKLPGWHRRNS